MAGLKIQTVIKCVKKIYWIICGLICFLTCITSCLKFMLWNKFFFRQYHGWRSGHLLHSLNEQCQNHKWRNCSVWKAYSADDIRVHAWAKK